jgi:hypothetical protein
MTGRLAPLRDRLHEPYASQRSGQGSAAATRVSRRRRIGPLLPPSAGPVVTTGFGSGRLLRGLVDHGYAAARIDLSRKQVALARAAGLGQVRRAGPAPENAAGH